MRISEDDWHWIYELVDGQTSYHAKCLDISQEEFSDILPKTIDIIKSKKKIMNIRGYARNTIKNLIIKRKHEINDSIFVTNNSTNTDEIEDDREHGWENKHREMCETLGIKYNPDDSICNIAKRIYEKDKTLKNFVIWRFFAGDDTYIKIKKKMPCGRFGTPQNSEIQYILDIFLRKGRVKRKYHLGMEDFLRGFFRRNPEISYGDFITHPTIMHKIPRSETRSAYYRIYKK